MTNEQRRVLAEQIAQAICAKHNIVAVQEGCIAAWEGQECCTDLVFNNYHDPPTEDWLVDVIYEVLLLKGEG